MVIASAVEAQNILGPKFPDLLEIVAPLSAIKPDNDSYNEHMKEEESRNNKRIKNIKSLQLLSDKKIEGFNAKGQKKCEWENIGREDIQEDVNSSLNRSEYSDEGSSEERDEDGASQYTRERPLVRPRGRLQPLIHSEIYFGKVALVPTKGMIDKRARRRIIKSRGPVFK